MERLFAIMLAGEDEKVMARVREIYEPTGDYFAVSGTTAMIRTTKSAVAIRDELGIDETPLSTTGIIFGLNGAYAGFFDPRVWEWIKGQKVYADA